jgi:hypothetical protein
MEFKDRELIAIAFCSCLNALNAIALIRISDR